MAEEDDTPKDAGKSEKSGSGAQGAPPDPSGKDAVYDVVVEVAAVLGTATMKVSQLLKMGRGAVVQLDRSVGDDVDIFANNRLVARGEVVVVDDHLAVTMKEIIRNSMN